MSPDLLQWVEWSIALIASSALIEYGSIHLIQSIIPLRSLRRLPVCNGNFISTGYRIMITYFDVQTNSY